MAAKMHKMFIGGKWVDAADGKTFEDMNPYTREVYAHLSAAKREDAKRAIEAAQAAFPRWAATPPSANAKSSSRQRTSWRDGRMNWSER
ncbi:MAG TPA: aldehyde dehydrogenase family protein [Anaerolineales bacterium]|nr:aldehyde dehydrogenase family protein [Anaerolineales bacterium]